MPVAYNSQVRYRQVLSEIKCWLDVPTGETSFTLLIWTMRHCSDKRIGSSVITAYDSARPRASLTRARREPVSDFGIYRS